MKLWPSTDSPRLTVLLAGLCAAGLLVLFVLPLAFSADRGSTEDRLFRQAVPLDDAAGSLDSAMLNMETGERGYLLTGEESFLQPYRQGQLAYASAVVSARRRAAQLGGDRPVLVGRTVAAAAAWQQNASAAIAAREQQGAAPATDALLQGKTLFDAYRSAVTPLLQRTAADRDTLSRELTDADSRRTLATAGSALLAVLLLGGLGLLLWQRIRLARRQLASDRYIRTLLDTSVDPMVVLDASDFRLLDVNHATEAVTGYSRAELLGMSAADLRLPDDRPALAETVGRALATGGTATPYPLTWLRKDGSQVPMEFTNGTAMLDGRAVIVATGRDISARLRAEEELRRNEHRLRAYFEHAHDIILAIEPGGVITYHSPAVTRVLGLPEDGITGSNLLALVHPEDREGALREFAARLAAPGAVHSGTLRVRHADGGWRMLETTAVNLRDDPEVRGLVITGRDVSERVRAEAEVRRINAELEQRVAERTAELATANAQLEGANKELESFTYTASHDLRAPLRTIDGFSRIVLEDFADVLPAEARRYLGTVREGAQQMARLIDDLLAFSRVGRQPLTKRPVQPRAIVQQVLTDLGTAEEGERLQICVGELPPAEADPALLKQVYMNLISNAIKYSRPRERAEITIGAEVDGPVPAYFVRDNGVGFDERYANKLFGAFQRLHRQEEFEGTGVGLAIVQRIVHRHGGRVWAQGKLDAGATFWFTLAPDGPAAEP